MLRSLGAAICQPVAVIGVVGRDAALLLGVGSRWGLLATNVLHEAHYAPISVPISQCAFKIVLHRVGRVLSRVSMS